MAKAFFFGNPYHGHTIPTLPVVAELVRRGEEIVYYNTRTFEPAITATGATFREYPDLGPLPGNVPLLDRYYWNIATSERIAQHEVDRVRREQPDYILFDCGAVWGSYIAHAVGVPSIWSVPILFMSLPVWGLAKRVMPKEKWKRKPLLEGIRTLRRAIQADRRIRRKHGIQKSVVLLPDTRSETYMVYASRELQPYAERFGDNFWFVGPTGVERVETETFGIDEGDTPLIFVSMGTFLKPSPRLIQTFVDALGDIDAQVVIAVGEAIHRSTPKHLPDNIRIVDYAPQLALLRKSSVFITHGGVGSASEALYYGVPTLLFPEAIDHYLISHRIAEEGAGLMFDQMLSVEELKSAVTRLLTETEFRENAQRLGQTLADAGGTRVAADTILDWLEDRFGRDQAVSPNGVARTA